MCSVPGIRSRDKGRNKCSLGTSRFKYLWTLSIAKLSYSYFHLYSCTWTFDQSPKLLQLNLRMLFELLKYSATYQDDSTYAQIREKIFTLTQLNASVISEIPWIPWILLRFRENSNTVYIVFTNKSSPLISFIVLFMFMKLTRRNNEKCFPKNADSSESKRFQNSSGIKFILNK